MNTTKKIFSTAFVIMMTLCSAGTCALNYQQEYTISSYESVEEVEKIGNAIKEASKKDPNVKVVKVKYKTEKFGDDTIYSVVMTCHVSRGDIDFLELKDKVMRQIKYM